MGFLWGFLVEITIKFIDVFSSQNYVAGIIFSTIVFRSIFFPLQYLNQKNTYIMKKIGPQLKEIHKQFDIGNPELTKEDLLKRKKLRNEILKDAGARPFALGCLPMLIQIPFYVLFIQAIVNHDRLIESTFLWLSLNERDTSFITPIILFIVTFIQMYFSNMTKRILVIVVFSVSMGLIGSLLPSSIVIYMITLSIYGTIQQFLINYKLKYSTSTIGKVSMQ